MPFSYVTYTGNGSVTSFSVPFEYLDPEHVDVSVGGSVLPRTAWTFVSSGLISLSEAPASGAEVRIFRSTPKERPLVEFANARTLRADALNTTARQMLFAFQEGYDDSQGASAYTAECRGYRDQAAALNASMAPYYAKLDQASGAPDGTKFAGRVLTVAELVAIPKANLENAMAVYVAGRVFPTDGGGGWFHWSAAETAAPNLGTIFASNEGGTGRWLRIRDNGFVNIRWFGATGGGSSDDTLAFRDAIAALGMFGGVLFLPRGTYRVTDHDADGACILTERPVSIVGEGGYSVITPFGVGTTVDTILYRPLPGVANSGVRFEGFFVGNSNFGRRLGRDGIRIDTQSALGSSQVTGFTMHNVTIAEAWTQEAPGGSPTGGRAFNHINNGTNNPEGGLYLSTFSRCVFGGGARFSASGDSLSMFGCTYSGLGNNVGLELDLVDAGDGAANQPTIRDGNFTAAGGAAKVISGNGVVFDGGNIEGKFAGALANNDGAVLNFVGKPGKPIENPTVRSCFVGILGTCDATHCIRFDRTVGATIVESRVIPGLPGRKGVLVTANAADTVIGTVSYPAALGIANLVEDSGVRTRGVTKPLTLAGSWTQNVNGGPATYMLTPDGFVELSGLISGGTGDVWLYSADLAPSHTQLFSVYRNDGGTVANGTLHARTDTNRLTLLGTGSPTISLTGVRWRMKNDGHIPIA